MELDSIKLEYIQKELNIEDLNADPLQQLKTWMDQVLRAEITYPNAVHLTTLGLDGFPQSRVVLLKEIENEGLVFYTNYDSPKAQEIKSLPKASINMFWKELDRQIRVAGTIEKVSREKSIEYFCSRPIESQISAIASPQGQVISKEELIDRVNKVRAGEISPPENWGGYILKPVTYEFWQGRPNRLHDRFRYRLDNKVWKIERLAP